MLFTSLEFVMFFLPLVMLVDYLLPKKFRNGWLLLVSLFFYAWGEPEFVFVMMLLLVINYFLAICIEKYNQKKKMFLFIAVSVNLLFLFVYKYLYFGITIMEKIFSTDLNSSFFQIALPLGISFYTFQSISYLVDVYRGEKAEHSIIDIGCYITLFPQVVAGPIVRYNSIKSQLHSREITENKIFDGIVRFCTGFNKKVLIANQLSLLADKIFAMETRSAAYAWIGAIAFTLQIYYDFSGYSDMAIGLGKMLGFDFEENFNYPYISGSVSEFWRRWHISLGTWFKDYLYFPLGGSRVSGKLRLFANLMVVWLATGIWHGANWGFVIWGVGYGLLISYEKMSRSFEYVRSHSLSRGLYQIFTIITVIVGWVIFKSEDIVIAGNYLTDMFLNYNIGLLDNKMHFDLRNVFSVLVFAIVFSCPIIPNIKKKIKNQNGIMTFDFAFAVIQMIGLTVSISYLVIGAHNPFIYFNF